MQFSHQFSVQCQGKPQAVQWLPVADHDKLMDALTEFFIEQCNDLYPLTEGVPHHRWVDMCNMINLLWSYRGDSLQRFSGSCLALPPTSTTNNNNFSLPSTAWMPTLPTCLLTAFNLIFCRSPTNSVINGKPSL